MARRTAFSTLYVAGMAALLLGAAVAGTVLTDESHSGFVGSIEVPVLVITAGLLLAAGIGAVRAPSASWPALVCAAGVVLAATLTFLTVILPDPGAVVIFELAGTVLGMILFTQVRPD